MASSLASVVSGSGRPERRPDCSSHFAFLLPCPGFDMTPNYVDASPTGIVVSPWCSCRGSGNMEEECEKFLRDFTENPCLRKSPSSGAPHAPPVPEGPWRPALATPCFLPCKGQ